MTSGIIEILIESLGVQALVGQDSESHYKVYPFRCPQGVVTDYIIVTEAGLTPSLSKGCPSTLDTVRYNVLCYSTDFRNTELLQEACRLALDTGTDFLCDAGVHFDSVYMVDRQDLFEQGVGEGKGLYVKLGVYEAVVNRTIT